jgi:DNA-binding response OmpR family regulator
MLTLGRKWLKPMRGCIKIYDLEIDTEFQRVRRGGQVIPLTPREYALLFLLAQHRGQVVTRAEVISHFYADDPDGAGRSNLVDVYIRFLRKKIDHGFWPRLILTRRRQGYLMRGGKV